MYERICGDGLPAPAAVMSAEDEVQFIDVRKKTLEKPGEDYTRLHHQLNALCSLSLLGFCSNHLPGVVHMVRLSMRLSNSEAKLTFTLTRTGSLRSFSLSNTTA